jgi:diaminopimelate epimerase
VSDLVAFAKYEAAGNDFLIVEDVGAGPALSADEVRSLCERWFGVGADGLIETERGTGAPFRMALTNADGTAAAISGNGLRCLAAYLHDRGRLESATVEVESGAGVRRVEVQVADGRVVGATVRMGEPQFARAAIPMRGAAWETFLGQPFDIGGGLTVTASAVSMGNPHLVLFLDEDPERFHVEHIGPALERHELFPEGVNVEFARVQDDGTVAVRVWERGVGETLACGTGACAVAVAAGEAGLVPGRVTVRFRGGTLTAERRDDGTVLLGGPVYHVFDGTVDRAGLGA